MRIKLRIWSHLLNKSLIENFIFYAVRPMKCAHDMLLQKALPLKHTKILNASILDSCFLDFVQLGILNFLICFFFLFVLYLMSITVLSKTY